MSKILFQCYSDIVADWEMSRKRKLPSLLLAWLTSDTDITGCIRVACFPQGLIFSLWGRDRGGRGKEEKLRNRWYKRTMRRSLFIVRAVCSPFNLQEINTGLCWNNEALAGHQQEERMALRGKGGWKGSRREMEKVERAKKFKGRADKNTRGDIETTLGFW